MSEEKLTYNATMFKETFQNDFTYLNGFLRNVHRFEERTALICPIRDLSWTYPQVNIECNRLAHALMEDGVKKQDLVMYQLLNNPYLRRNNKVIHIGNNGYAQRRPTEQHQRNLKCP